MAMVFFDSTCISTLLMNKVVEQTFTRFFRYSNLLFKGTLEEEMDTLKTEIESWSRFGYSLREENRILFHQMLDKCRKSKYFKCVNAKGENYSAESLFLILILEQQKMINDLLERALAK